MEKKSEKMTSSDKSSGAFDVPSQVVKRLRFDPTLEDEIIDATMMSVITQDAKFAEYNQAGLGIDAANRRQLVPATSLKLKTLYPIVSIKRVKEDSVC